MEAYRFTPGATPLLVSMPHVGTHLPAEVAAGMTEAARALPDTDWHVDTLYDFLGDLGASVLAATQSRYVIDLNRPPDDAPLYPGASNTGLCPTTTFAGEPIYLQGAAPDAAETESRRAQIWRPYHDRLEAELAAIEARHGVALLWEAHSIRSRVPRLFEGRLPELNLGTAGGASAAPELRARLSAVAAAAQGYSHAVDGRFTGGYNTRAFGAPQARVHAVQLELSQITYMDEDPPYAFREDLAAGIRPVLQRFLEHALAWAAEQVTGR
jgi:N-formylglutamate deformylase